MYLRKKYKLSGSERDTLMRSSIKDHRCACLNICEAFKYYFENPVSKNLFPERCIKPEIRVGLQSENQWAIKYF